jgi:hypothetical protein
MSTRESAIPPRLSAPPLFTGRGSLRIARRLNKLDFETADAPVSFLVDKKNRLVEGELGRAQAWGARLAG